MMIAIAVCVGATTTEQAPAQQVDVLTDDSGNVLTDDSGNPLTPAE
jgi:hypothetical protein